MFMTNSLNPICLLRPSFIMTHLIVCFLSDKLYASPAFVRNISHDNSSSCMIHIKARCFGSRPPHIPVATTVTLARIASPSSLEKHLQNEIIRSVRLYFGINKCLVKKGDIITIPIDVVYGFAADDIVHDLDVAGDIDDDMRVV